MIDVEEQTTVIVDFLRGIGVAVEAVELTDDGFLPAMTVRDGTVLYDPARLRWPGDLLHEAGHVAVTDPELRPTVSEFEGGGQEMAAIAWSYAAARAAGVDTRVVFHDGGYRDGGSHLAETFDGGAYIGLPMLQWYGLAARDDEDHPPYPAMKRWLR